jgi:hypothetical protein
MKSMSDQELAQSETLLRQRLAQLAAHAPTAVHMPDEVAVVATHRPSGRGRRAGVIAAVTALIGAGGFTTYSFLGASNDGGAATPQEAVMTFASALEHEDVLGMIEVTLPEEVVALRTAVDSASSDAKRIGLLDDAFDAGGVQGIDVSVDDLVLDTNFLEGGVAAVTATGGTVSASFDPKSFPYGTKLRELLAAGAEGTTMATVFGNTDSPPVLMTVERDGRWYVSVEYTIAEYIRRAAGWELPGPVTRTPVGFDSPDAAANGLYERLATMDVQSAIDTFAPGEDALAWLAQSWIADAQSAIDRARANGWSVAVSGLTYETIGSGDALTLRPLTFKVEGTTPVGFNQDSSAAEPTGDPQPFTVEYADGCSTVTGSLAQSMLADPTPSVTLVDGGYQVCSSDNEMLGTLGLLVLGNGTQLPAVAVVQSGGKWYVSPLGTLLGNVTLGLHDVGDGSSLFDSPIAPYIYGGVSRTILERMVIDQQAGAVSEGCLPALTVENGIVTGVVADPPIAAIRFCAGMPYYGSESSGSAELPTVAEAVPESTVPASTVPASTAPATTAP